MTLSALKQFTSLKDTVETPTLVLHPDFVRKGNVTKEQLQQASDDMRIRIWVVKSFAKESPEDYLILPQEDQVNA